MNSTPTPTPAELDDELFFALLELRSLERQRGRLNQTGAWSDAICLRASQLDAKMEALQRRIAELENEI